MSLRSHDKDSPFPPIQDSVLRVYSMRFCPYARRTLLVLEHKNIPYEVVNIDLKSKPEWFLERNPVGTVPTIEKGDTVIYESTATSEWIDDVYPCPRLAPTDPLTKAQDRMLLEYFGKVTRLYYNSVWLGEGREEALPQLQKHFEHYDRALAKREGPFFGGASPSLLDFYLWPHFERITVFALDDPQVGVSEKDCPTLTNWLAHMSELPAVKKLQHSPETFNHYFQTSRAGKPDYNIGL